MTGFRQLKFSVIWAVCFLLFSSGISIADVPQYISYQGKIMEDGISLTGSRTITFSLWSTDSGGDPSTGLFLWSETQTVAVIEGIYNVQLGDITSFPADLHTNDELFLQVNILHPTEGLQRLSPLMPLNSTMYALKAANADTLDGRDPSEFDQADHLINTENPHSVTASQLGAVTTETDPTVLTSVKDGISWTEVSNRPAGLDDGDDTGITSESDPTVLTSVKDGISWTEVSGRPAGLDDGDDVGITSETDPQVGTVNNISYVPRWNGSSLNSGTIYDNLINVGIGTNSPTEKLDVAGSINMSGSLKEDGEPVLKLGGGGGSNLILGKYSGSDSSTGYGNIIIGMNAGLANTTGGFNTFIGGYSGQSNTTGSNNIFIGYTTGMSNKTGNLNTFIGRGAGIYSKGSSNTFLGSDAGRQNLSGSGNIFIGTDAGYNETGSDKLYIDNSDTAEPLIYGEFDNDLMTINGALSVTGDINTSGVLTMDGTTVLDIDSTNNNTFLGENAGKDTTTGNNTFFGHKAGLINTTGDLNTFIGLQAGWTNQDGSGNTFLGHLAGWLNTSGSYNTFLGYGTGFKNTEGASNTFVGYLAGHSNEEGNLNTFLGYNAGYNETGSNKLYIDNSDTTEPLIYGDFSSDEVTINGRLGIGTTSPGAGLHIKRNDGEWEDSFAIFDTVAIDQDVGIRFNESGDYKGSLFHDAANDAIELVYKNGDYYRRLVLKSNGNVGIGTRDPNYDLDVRGTIGNNTTTYHSDRRWKKDVQPIVDSLDKVVSLQGVSFEWRGDDYPDMNFPDGEHLGLIAQDVEEVVSEVVHTNSDGYKSVEYANLVPLLIEALKEQQETISALAERLAELEKKIKK